MANESLMKFENNLQNNLGGMLVWVLEISRMEPGLFLRNAEETPEEILEKLLKQSWSNPRENFFFYLEEALEESMKDLWENSRRKSTE